MNYAGGGVLNAISSGNILTLNLDSQDMIIAASPYTTDYTPGIWKLLAHLCVCVAYVIGHLHAINYCIWILKIYPQTQSCQMTYSFFVI